jgi:uncharacterized protein YjbI with pentapeptide repeats
MMVRSLRALAVAVGLLWPGAAWACSCASIGPDEFFADRFVAGIGILFEGVMLRAEDAQPPSHGKTGVFRVIAVHKGEIGRLVRITYQQADGANCGTSFQRGVRVFVAASGTAERGYYTGMCTQGPVSFGRGNDEIMAAIQRYRLRLTGLDLAIARNSGSVDPIIAKARFLGSTSQQAAALRLLDDVLVRDPNTRAAVLLAAQLHSSTQHDEQALAVLDPYLTAHPTDHDAGRTRVLSLIRLGRSTEVSAEWRDFSGLVRQRYGPAVERIDFTNRVLDGASFRRADLTNIDFTASVLKDSDFSASRLWEARFDRADLTGADFRKADISGTFVDADLTGAKLTGGMFRVLAPRANLAGADLTGATFSIGSVLTDARAANVRAPGSHYEVREMVGIDFTGADLRDTKFWSSDLHGASFRDADLTGALFRNMLSAPEQIDLRGVDFTGAKLDNVTFASALYDCATRWPVGFDLSRHPLLTTAPDAGACARKPDFSWLREPVLAPGASRYATMSSFANMNLAGVSFHGAWLPGQNFSGANLRGADFARSKGELGLSGADATGADFSYVDFYHSSLSGFAGSSNATVLDGAIFRGAIMWLRTMNPGGDKWLSPDLSKARLDGMIFHDDPATWPDEIDPVRAGIVFLDSSAAADRFGGYNLKGKDLRFFDLDRGNFRDVDLSGADLRGALLAYADFTRANVTGAKLRGACYGHGTKWSTGLDIAASGAVYCGPVESPVRYGGPGVTSSWSHTRGGLDATGARHAPRDTPVPDFAGETWDEVEWVAAWLPGSKLDGGSFQHATVKGANLNGASFKGADLTGIDLRDVIAEGADFTDAILRNADLRMSSLKDATLIGADLTGAAYDDRTVWPAGFDPVKAGAEKLAPVQP